MMNTTKYQISLLLLTAGILLSSCSEDWALKEETFALAEENDGWVPREVNEESFIMTDNYGISQGFIMNSEEYYLDKSWGGFLGLNTHMTFTEYRSRSYSSTYGNKFFAAIRASTWEPYGDQIRMELNDVSFAYDLAQKIVSEVSVSEFRIGSSQTSEGFKMEDFIHSKCELLDSISIDSTVYKDILHFTLEDNPTKWTSFTVTEIFYAKESGLIKYVLNNDTYYLREAE